MTRSPLPRQSARKRRSDAIYTRSRKIVRERSGGRCEVGAEGCTIRAVVTHHRAGRGFDGCHEPTLLLDCCRHCHDDAIHAHPAEAYERGWMLHRNALDAQRRGDVA